MAINSKNFENGAFIISRSIFESEIWFKPPEYLKIWLYLLGKANHGTRKIKGYTCERGQYFCDYRELLEQLRYKVGYREHKYHESFMKNLMKHLRDTLMITSAKKPRGVLITICNYSDYQVIKNYEKTNEKTNEKTSSKPALNQTPLSINKNVKNYKNVKKKDKTFTENEKIFIESFWPVYPPRKGKRSGKKEALKLFLKIPKDNIPQVLIGVRHYTVFCRDTDTWPKDASTWLRNKKWEEWQHPHEPESRQKESPTARRVREAKVGK